MMTVRMIGVEQARGGGEATIQLGSHYLNYGHVIRVTGDDFGEEGAGVCEADRRREVDQGAGGARVIMSIQGLMDNCHSL